MDISLSFGLWWVSACCQDVTNLIVSHLKPLGVSLLAYIDDFYLYFFSSTKEEVTHHHFNSLCATFSRLGIEEAAHKACPPSQVMVWLDLRFDSANISITIPPDNIDTVMQLVSE